MPYLFALLAIFLWASFAFLGATLIEVPAFFLLGIGMLIGSLCGLPWIKDWKVSFSSLALGIYGLFGYHFFLFMAFRNAPALEANLINYLWPLLIVLFSPVFLDGFKLRPVHFVAGILGFAGALLIATGGSLKISTDYLEGYIYAAIAALIWSSYSLLSRKLSNFSTGSIGLFCLISGIMALIFHYVLESSYTLSKEQILPILALGVGPMGFAFFCWDKAIKQGDPRIIGTLSYLTPLLSTGFLILAGKGQFTWISGLAMLLIIAGALPPVITDIQNE